MLVHERVTGYPIIFSYISIRNTTDIHSHAVAYPSDIPVKIPYTTIFQFDGWVPIFDG